MRTSLKFFVAGIPKAQPRARATARGGFARVYDPGTADDWKMIVRSEARKAWVATGDVTPFSGPTCVNLTFYFPRPKNHFKSQSAIARTASAPPILKANAPNWHTSKPDKDNSEKAVLDALVNLGLLADDKQVCDGRTQKLYEIINKPGWTTGCLIEILPLEIQI